MNRLEGIHWAFVAMVGLTVLLLVIHDLGSYGHVPRTTPLRDPHSPQYRQPVRQPLHRPNWPVIEEDDFGHPRRRPCPARPCEVQGRFPRGE